jgi:uncharacterized membrane protein
MKAELVHWASQFPAPLATVIIAALPILELRGSIPWASTLGGLSPMQAYLWSVLGNFLPVPFFLAFLGQIEKGLRRFGPFDTFFCWLFARTLRRADVVERYGALGLVLFVAVPLPVTGAWTGTVAAYLFQIPARRAAPAILAGVCIAGIVVTLAVQGILHLW